MNVIDLRNDTTDWKKKESGEEEIIELNFLFDYSKWLHFKLVNIFRV